MFTLIAFYSFTGRTHYEARRLFEKLDAGRPEDAEPEVELYEVREQKRRSLFSAFVLGPAQAKRRKPAVIEPIAVNMEDYDRIIIMCPVWGGSPAPAFNSILRELPQGREVQIVLTSDSGKASDLDELKARVERRGVEVTDVRVIKTEDLRKREKRYRKRMKLEQAKDSRD